MFDRLDNVTTAAVEQNGDRHLVNGKGGKFSDDVIHASADVDDVTSVAAVSSPMAIAGSGEGRGEERVEGVGEESDPMSNRNGGLIAKTMARSPEMAPRLVYRNKKYGRKSCPTSLKSPRLFDKNEDDENWSLVVAQQEDDPDQQDMKTNGHHNGINSNNKSLLSRLRFDEDLFTTDPEDDMVDGDSSSTLQQPQQQPTTAFSSSSAYFSTASSSLASPLGTLSAGPGVVGVKESGGPPPCDVFSTSPPPPLPPGGAGSADLSSTSHGGRGENIWAQDFSYIDNQNSIISLGQTSSLGSEPSGCLEYAVFTALDPQCTGSTSVACVLEYWECLGICDPGQVLLDLGISRERQLLDLHHLSYLLIQEVNQSQEILSYVTVWTAIQTFLAEIKVLKTILENHARERDKLRSDLQETNQRLAVLIQEGDEQTTKQDLETKQKLQSLEAKYQEQLKEADRKYHEDKEASITLLRAQSEEASRNLARYKQEQEALQAEIHKLVREVSRLEQDNKSLLKSKKEVPCLPHKPAEEQSHQLQLVQKQDSAELNVLERTKFSLIEQELRDLSLANKALQDKNDEMEAMIHSQRNEIERLKNVQVISVRGADSESQSDHCISKIEVGGDDSCSPDKNDSSITNIITDILKSENPGGMKEGPSSLPVISSKKRIPGLHLEQHCKHLEGKLDQVKFEIMRVLAEREAFSKENESLKQYKMAFLQLLAQNQNIQRDLEKLQIPTPFLDSPSSLSPDFKEGGSSSSSTPPGPLSLLQQELNGKEINITELHSNKDINMTDSLVKKTQVSFSQELVLKEGKEVLLKEMSKEMMNKEGISYQQESQAVSFHQEIYCNPLEVHRSSPDGQEFDVVPLLKENLQISQLEKEKVVLEKERKMLQEQVSSLQQENQDLCTRCSRLETEMRMEAESREEEAANTKSKIEDLEQSLDMMKSEFESMEDYWQTKLEEERSFYEEQLRKNEDEFSKLEIQMQEYETLYDSKKMDDDRLSTIEESCSMEAQISDWEDEIQQLKLQLQLEEDQGKLLRDQLETGEKDMEQLRKQLVDLENKNSIMEEVQQQWSKKLTQVEESCRTKVQKLQEELNTRSIVEAGKQHTDKELWKLSLVKSGEATATAPLSLTDHSNSRSSNITFIPHSPRQGPSSLPSDLITPAQREVKRLQELRRIIQEECDALLLKKERLKEEVGQLCGHCSIDAPGIDPWSTPTLGHEVYTGDTATGFQQSGSCSMLGIKLPRSHGVAATKNFLKNNTIDEVHDTGDDIIDTCLLKPDTSSLDRIVEGIAGIEQKLMGESKKEEEHHARSIWAKTPVNACSDNDGVAVDSHLEGDVKIGFNDDTSQTGVGYQGGDEGYYDKQLATTQDKQQQHQQQGGSGQAGGVGGHKDAWTQLPGTWVDQPGADTGDIDTLSALLMAYKVVYMDIERERKLLEIELKDIATSPMVPTNPGSPVFWREDSDHLESNRIQGMNLGLPFGHPSSSPDTSVHLSVSLRADSGVYTCLQQRVEDQQQRCSQLQSALARQKEETTRVLQNMREQHREEVHQLEGLVASAQHLLTKQTDKYSQQMEKLSLADRVIMELLSENETLNTALLSLQTEARRPAVLQRMKVSRDESSCLDSCLDPHETLHVDSDSSQDSSRDSSLEPDEEEREGETSTTTFHFVYQVEEI